MDAGLRLSQSFAYQAKRRALLDAERDLALQREKVAGMRRDLPRDTPIPDYVFATVPGGNEVSLSSLVGERDLLIYHLMYGKAQIEPCPMCTMWIDGFDAIHQHVAERADFIVVAAAEPAAIGEHADARGWTSIPLYSAADSTFKRDLGSEGDSGEQHPAISVIGRTDGELVHVYTARPSLSETMHERGLDLFSPVWNLLDLTSAGRGDWYPSLSY